MRLTDEKIIQALRDGKKIQYPKYGVLLSMSKSQKILWNENECDYANIDIFDLEADDWEIVPDEK